MSIFFVYFQIALKRPIKNCIRLGGVLGKFLVRDLAAFLFLDFVQSDVITFINIINRVL